MQIKGLEPPKISSIEPKSIVSTNFTISADGYGGIRTRGHTIKSHMLYQLSYVPFFLGSLGIEPKHLPLWAACSTNWTTSPWSFLALIRASFFFKIWGARFVGSDWGINSPCRVPLICKDYYNIERALVNTLNLKDRKDI